MTWFISINPLCVMLIDAVAARLVARSVKRPDSTRCPRGAWRQARSSSGGSYLLLAALSWKAGNVAVHWQWFALFLVVLTFGELFILPTGLGLFARLAPQRLGATTVASWFLATFAGNLAAGLVGTLWTRMSHPAFFVLARRDLRCSPPLDCACMDSRARQVARVPAPKPIPVDNSLIRTLVSAIRVFMAEKSRENADDSLFQSLA